MGEWHELDRRIAEMELEQLRAMNATENVLEKYFAEKRRRELAKKSMKDLTWDEVYLLDDLKKSQGKYYSDDVERIAKNAVENKDGVDKFNEVINTLDVIISHPKASGFKKQFQEIRSTLIQRRTKRNAKRFLDNFKPEEQIYSESADVNLSLKKSAEKITIAGFANVEIVDRHSDLVKLSALKNALPQYLENGAIVMLNHSNRPIGKIIKHDWRRSYSGDEGLFIEAELFKGTDDIVDMINKGVLKGFSIGGTAIKKEVENKCDKINCWREIKELKLWEISLVTEPANQQSFITAVN